MPAAPERLMQILRRNVDDQRVLDAIAEVPRDVFVPPDLRDQAWENVPLPIGSGQTISQPLVVARMCELLELSGDETVLDVGTGSGYHAALLARLARHVYSIEVHASLSRQAAEHLRAAGVENVTLEVGDGSRGLLAARALRGDQRRGRRRRRDPARAGRAARPRRPAGGAGGDRRPAPGGRPPHAGGRDAHPARARALRAAGQLTRLRRGLGRSSRPTLPPGRPSTITTSAVKSFEPRMQRGADAVGVDRHALGLELPDAVGGEAAGDDDLHVAGGRRRRALRARAGRARG